MLIASPCADVDGETQRAEEASRPRLKFHCGTEAFEPEHLIVFTEDSHHILRGRAFVVLAPLLDGRRTTDEVMAIAGDSVPYAQAYYALDHMTRRGLVDVAGAPPTASALATYLDALGPDAAASMRHLRSARVCVQGVGGADTVRLEGALAAVGVEVVTHGADLSVVVASDYLDGALAAINRAQLVAATPWMLLRSGGLECWLGPLFVPGMTACWECLAHRLRESRQIETWLEGKQEGGRAILAPFAGSDTTLEAGAQLAATEILKWAAHRRNDQLAGQVVSVDLAGTDVRRHRVSRRPQCRACGDPRPRLAGPVGLTRMSGDAPREDGIDSHESLLARFGHHISPLTGIVHSIEECSIARGPVVHNAVAVHYFPMFKDDVAVLQKNVGGRSGGKGTSPIQAKASALGEALERYSGVWQGDWEPTVRASLRELAGDAVSVESLLLFSDRQYAGRQDWNRALRSPHQVVPAPLGPDTVIDWTPAWSLTHQRMRRVPAAYCWYGHPELQDLFCLADSNGCAAGASREDAILSGLFELIERDAVALWWYSMAARPALDLASFAIPYCDALRRQYDAAGRDVWLLDISTDLGVPCFVALSARRAGPSQDIIFGFAAHLDARKAVQHAITELNQSYAFVAETGADGQTIYRAENAEMLDWLRTASVQGQPYLAPAPQLPLRTVRDFSAPWPADPADAVVQLTDRLRLAGLEVLVVDQTRPDIGLPVWRVIVPGLRHFWRRLGRGRLFDVPVKLGWLDQPRTETELNPFSVFI